MPVQKESCYFHSQSYTELGLLTFDTSISPGFRIGFLALTFSDLQPNGNFSHCMGNFSLISHNFPKHGSFFIFPFKKYI